MKLLKLIATRRIRPHRSWTQHHLKPTMVVPQSLHKTYYFFTYNSPRFYCVSSVKPDHSVISSQKFQPAANTAEMEILTDDELFQMITQLRESAMTKTNDELRGYSQTPFVRSLEEECVRRAREIWKLDKTLDVLEMFHPRGRFLCPNLLFWLLRKKFKAALKSEAATMMKYITTIENNKFWKAYHVHVYYIEYTLIRRLDQLSLPEISALLHVINSRHGKVISEKLIGNLYDRLRKEIDVVDFRTLNTFLLFFSNQKTNLDFTQIADYLIEGIQKSDCSAGEVIAVLCIKKNIHNLKILDRLAQRVIDQLPNMKIVELENIITALVYFNYNSRGIYEKLIDNLEVEPLRSALITHPKRFAKILGNLCLINVYPYKQIDYVLSEEFLKEAFGKKLNHHNVIREVMILDGCVKAECQDYEGNKLDDSLEENLVSRWSSHIHHYLQTDGDTVIIPKSVGQDKIEYKPSAHNKMILDVRSILRGLFGGPEYVHTCYTLPFLPRPDLLFCLNAAKNPIKLSDEIIKSIRVDYKNLDKSVDWYVIMCVHQNPILNGETIIYGKDIAKERILKKFGFKLITVGRETWRDWSDEEKKNYFNKFIL